MATSHPTFFIPGLVASGDLSSSQYRLVKYASTAGAVILAAGNTDKAIGVLYNEPTDGQAAEIAIGPIVKAQGQASLSVNDYVAPDTTGRAEATTTTSDQVFGIVQEASTTAGDIVRIMVSRFVHP
jgi:hypothetical protein